MKTITFQIPDSVAERLEGVGAFTSISLSEQVFLSFWQQVDEILGPREEEDIKAMIKSDMPNVYALAMRDA